METIEHRQRRLSQLADLIDQQLDSDWLYVLVLGRPGDTESTNMVTNAPLELQEEIVDIMRQLVKRHESGVRPREL